MRDIKVSLDEWVKEGRQVALATVVSTWGSSPRQPGARMAVDSEGKIEGSVSGGCVEGAVVSEALKCLADGSSRLLHFGVSDEQAWQVGLSCGGQLEVTVQPLDLGWWQAVSEGLAVETPLVCVSEVGREFAAERLVVARESEIVWSSGELDSSREKAYLDLASLALKENRSRRETVAENAVFVDCVTPRPRLLLIGGAHVAVALQMLARQLGFRVILIDPRRAFATRERFPEAEAIHHEYPQEVLPHLGLDANTYVAILTHDPKIDDPALLEALPSLAPYVGVLSSRRTHEKRLARLREYGLAEPLMERIRTPIGLDIGAKTPEEIALAILAEIVSVMRKGSQAQ